jgi:hypothetical protein
MIRRMVRIGIVVATLAAAAFIGTPSASASPSFHGGCNGSFPDYHLTTCIDSYGYAGGLYIADAFIHDNGVPGDVYGHFHTWGPGVNRNSNDQWWHSGCGTACNPTVFEVGGGPPGTVCTEFWELVNGSYESHGLPCVPTH